MKHPIPFAVTVFTACLALPTLLPAQQTGEKATAAKTESEQKSDQEKPAIAVIRPDGVYQDLAEQSADLTALLMGGSVKPKPFYEFLDHVEQLASSKSPQVVLDLSGTFAFQMVHMPEIARAIDKVKKAGKHVTAYLENADPRSYQLASMCDEILMADLGVLDIGAPAMNVMFMRDALDLLGVHFDVVRCGEFKGAVEPYILPAMSEHLRKHYLAMLERINAAGVERMAKGRHTTVDKIRDAQGKRLFTAEQAHEAGLVDRLVPWRGAEAAMRDVLDDQQLAFDNVLEQKKSRHNVNFMQLISQIFNPREDEGVADQDSIVVLHLSGTIVDGEKDAPGNIVSKPTVKMIDKLRKNDHVKGVVLRINSPGGSATASEAILLALKDLSDAKPVVISMGSLAASGGYYITCIHRPILAEAETITGSIGVFGMKPSVGALMRRVGLHSELIALDASASMESIDEPWTDEQKARVQSMVNKIYGVFVGHVAASRAMQEKDVLKIAGGRVWSGAQAVDNGLVDKLGGLEDAIAMVEKEAGVEGKPEIQHLPRPRNFLESVLSDMMDAQTLIPDPMVRTLAKKLDLDRALAVLQDALGATGPTTIWAIAPDALMLR